jgi:hypothetical protein
VRALTLDPPLTVLLAGILAHDDAADVAQDEAEVVPVGGPASLSVAPGVALRACQLLGLQLAAGGPDAVLLLKVLLTLNAPLLGR